MSKRYDISCFGSQTRGLASDGVTGVPSMNKHNNLLSFLSIVQYYDIDYLKTKWRDGVDPLGIGASAEVRERFVSSKRGFAFKRHRGLGSTNFEHALSGDELDSDENQGCSLSAREKIFNELVSEVTVLGYPPIRYHQNFVRIEGVYWEVPPDGTIPWPVLILEKADLGDLWSFARTPEGRRMTMQQRIGICLDMAQAMTALHENGK
jgi:hypothetical protein